MFMGKTNAPVVESSYRPALGDRVLFKSRLWGGFSSWSEGRIDAKTATRVRISTVVGDAVMDGATWYDLDKVRLEAITSHAEDES